MSDEHYGPGRPINANDLADIIAERDRLRAVVERVTFHIRQLQHVDALLGTGDDEDEEDLFRGWWAAAVRALVELDVSPTGEDA